jgi:hypothetical protein
LTHGALERTVVVSLDHGVGPRLVGELG